MKQLIEVIGVAIVINALSFFIVWLAFNLEVINRSVNLELTLAVFLLGWSGGCILTHAYYKWHGEAK